MTKQIQGILESIRDDNFFENEAVVLKNYIEKIEHKYAISIKSIKTLDQEISDLKNSYESLRGRFNQLISKGFQALHCPSCQGGGCPMCGGSGFVFGRDISFVHNINEVQS